MRSYSNRVKMRTAVTGQNHRRPSGHIWRNHSTLSSTPQHWVLGDSWLFQCLFYHDIAEPKAMILEGSKSEACFRRNQGETPLCSRLTTGWKYFKLLQADWCSCFDFQMCPNIIPPVVCPKSPQRWTPGPTLPLGVTSISRLTPGAGRFWNGKRL